jgi:hypothetical protein
MTPAYDILGEIGDAYDGSDKELRALTRPRGCASPPRLFRPKSLSAWPTQVADHLVPNQVLGFFEFFRERERGKFSVFKGLQKPLSAQIQGN